LTNPPANEPENGTTTPPKRYANLGMRALTAIVGATIVILSLVYGPWTYFGVFTAIGLLTMLEFYRLAGLDGMVPLKFYGTFCGMALSAGIFLTVQNALPTQYMYLAFPLLAMVFFINLYKKNAARPFTNIAYTFLGIIYVALPFAGLHVLAYSQGGYEYEIVLGCLFLLWASDTGAYFAGSALGRKKLFARISPKKSWEGFVGGLLTACGVAVLLGYYFTVLRPEQWVVCAVIIVVAGTMGDLVESLFKRSISIKDSGSGLPGHGGWLDRFDGLLLATPFLVAFLKIF